MKILVIGSGGREHALAYRLSREHEVICAPGNPGMAPDFELVDIPASDAARLVKLCKERKIDLAVVGPEDLLILGLADILREAGITTFGPGVGAARLEGSKEFSKNLMSGAKIPTAAFEAFTDVGLAISYAKASYDRGIQLAVKVSGNALGKGVAVCDTYEEAVEALNRAMIAKEFGAAGEIVVLEERLVGREFSLLTIVGDHNTYNLPIAQDYKRALDDDQGPNTGGMGSFSPCRWASDALIDEVDRTMVASILAELRARELPFRGLLFTGVMVTPDGPKCLEYNVRFGDPETQTVMMRLEGGFGEALFEAASGAAITPPKVFDHAAVTVVVASKGYPLAYEKGKAIDMGEDLPNTKLFFAGVASSEGKLVNSGGRVVGVSAVGTTVQEARELAYRRAASFEFEGSYFRGDIASDA